MELHKISLQKGVILKIKIFGKEELSSSMGYAIQKKGNILETPNHISNFNDFEEKTIYLPTRHFTYIMKIVYKWNLLYSRPREQQ